MNINVKNAINLIQKSFSLKIDYNLIPISNSSLLMVFRLNKVLKTFCFQRDVTLLRLIFVDQMFSLKFKIFSFYYLIGFCIYF